MLVSSLGVGSLRSIARIARCILDHVMSDVSEDVFGAPMEYQGAATFIDVALLVTNADFLLIHSPPRGTMPPLGKNPAERRGEPHNQILQKWYDPSNN